MSEIQIKSFEHHDGPLADYLGLVQRVEGLSDDQAKAEAAGTRALLDSANSFYANGTSRNFLAYRGDTPVGRLTAFRNRMLHGDQARCGLVGLFACEDNAEVARAAINAAADWLREQGLETVRGPMAGDIWHRWRFMTRGFDTAPFPGEPRQPDYYPRLFTAAGFAPVRVYSTKLIADMQAQLDRFKKAVAFNQQRGISYRNMDGSRWHEELGTLYELCRHSFASSWGVSETTREEFISIYDRWLARSGPDHIIFAVDNRNDVVGLGLAIVRPADTINLKTIAILPEHSGYGLGQAIAAELYQRALSAGQQQAQHCLMDPLSPVQRWDRGLGQVTREYTIYERSV
jgi:GNAT superfamily N-acetyltransferase